MANNPSVVIALSAPFSVMLGYQAVIESMLGAGVGGKMNSRKAPLRKVTLSEHVK